MADSTEGGGLGKPQKTCNDDEKNNDAENEEDLDCLEVRSSSPFRLIEKIDPKDLDQMIKILYSSHRKSSTQSLILQPFEIIARVTLRPSLQAVIEENEGTERSESDCVKDNNDQTDLTHLTSAILSEIEKRLHA